MHPSPQRELLQGSEIDIFSTVSHGATPKQWADWLRAPLEHAAANGNLDLVEKLLRAGANGSAGWRGCRGRTLLDAAALGGNADVVSALLCAGAHADVNVVSAVSRRSALYEATACGHEAVARRLILAGADVNFRDPIDKEGCVLFKATTGGHDQLVKDLLAGGACPNGSKTGCIPLHVAALRGYTRIMFALLAGGADKNKLDRHGCPAISYAIGIKQFAAVKILLAAGADVSLGGPFSALTLASCTGCAPTLKAVLQHGSDANNRDAAGRTALHAAAEYDQAGAIYTLIDAGADVDAQRFNGGTPLHYAAYKSSCKAMLALLDSGANVNAYHSETGQTPLHVACQRQNRGLDSAVDLLLRRGATETAVGGDGRTAAELLRVYRADRRLCSGEEIKRARELVARAEEDRAWRRRCWPVILRSRAEKVRALRSSSSSSSSSLKANVEPPVALAGDPKDNDAIVCTVGHHADDGPHVDGGAAEVLALDDMGTGGDRVEEECSFGGVVAMLVGLNSEGVFREIVAFL